MLPRLLLLASLPLAAQPPQPDATFRTETRLALVRFHAVQKNRYVENLTQDDIQLLEDGKAQKIAVFEGPASAGRRTVPVEVILLFDVSMSVMNENLLDPFSLKQGLLDAIGPEARISMYAFAQRMQRFSGPTRDVGRMKAALGQILEFAHLGTRLYEAIMFAAHDSAQAGGNVTRIMVIFSDGEPTTRTKPEEAVKIAAAEGIQLYPVVLGHERVRQRLNQAGGGGMRGAGPGNPNGGNPNGGNPSKAQLRARDLEREMLEFASIGEATGGRSFDPPTVSAAVIRTILAGLVDQVRAQYVVGYDPGPAGEAQKPHKVQVKILAKDKGKLYGGVRSVMH
jgi:Ca-activated chloride channel homolog